MLQKKIILFTGLNCGIFYKSLHSYYIFEMKLKFVNRRGLYDH